MYVSKQALMIFLTRTCIIIKEPAEPSSIISIYGMFLYMHGWVLPELEMHLLVVCGAI